MLEEYGKLVADQIICATFPGLSGSAEEIVSQIDSFEGAFITLSEQEIDRNRVRCEDYGTVGSGIDPTEPFDFQRKIIEMGSNNDIQNPFALELYARVNDFYIDPVEDILKVHVAIPTFILDQVPELPSREELEEEAASTRNQVKLSVDKLFGQMVRLSTSLKAFGKYQSYFYQTQNGFLKYKESEKDFYATRVSSKIDQFYSDLKQLAKKNKINIRSNIPSVMILNADNVRIEFKNGPNGNPYIIKAIYAWKEGCEEKKLTKGIKKFKKTYDKKPTVMNYVAKLNDIDKTLTARETPPWLDFLVKYTYPLVSVEYGSLNMQSVGDTLGKCVEENAREFGGDLRDYILNEALSFMETLSFQYSSAASCEELYSTENQPEVKEFEKDFGFDEGRAVRRKAKDEYKDKTGLERVNDRFDKMRSDIDSLQEKIRLLKMSENSITNLLETRESDKLDFDLNGGDPSVGREIKRDIKEYKKQLKNIEDQIENSEEEIQKIRKKANEINEDMKDLDMSGGTSRYLNRQAKKERKAAAKKARKNAKNHPYAKKAAKVALDEMKRSDTLLSSLIDWEKYEKEGKLSRKKFERNNEEDSYLKDILSRLSICSANELASNAIRCLFSGVTKERAFDKMFRSAMKAMDLDVFGFFIDGLPPNVQSELRQKLQAEFGDIPLPWEEEYESGANKNNQYKKYLSSDSESEAVKQKREAELERLRSRLEEMERDYDSALETKAKLMVDQEDAQKAYDEAKRKADAFKAQDPIPGFLPEAYEQAKKDVQQEARNKLMLLTNISARISGINDPGKLLIDINKIKEMIKDLEQQESDKLEDFKNLTDEEKNQVIEEQKKAQGTFGTALANVQEEVVNAYIEYMFDVMNIDQIGQALSEVPGGTLVFNTLDQIFKCSSQGLFNPPLKSFLSSFSLDVCGEDRHIGLAIPSAMKEIQIPEFSKAFFIKKLKNAFIAKVETVITKVITMLLLKLFETIDAALCKSLNALGQSLIGTVTGGPGAGLDEAFADAFCPEADEDELDNIKKNAFGNALGKGAAPDSAYDCLFRAVNGTMSKREIIDLLTNTPSNMDDATASKFATLVNSRCPELSDLLGNAEDVKDAFGSIGKFIPPDLRDYLRNQPTEDLDAPIYDAICLTQDELDLWNSKRKQLYLDNGLDEETADELINKANDRALDNLGALADIVQKGPEGLLGEAIDAILKQPDPGCANDPAAIILEDETLAAQKSNLLNDYFKTIEKRFLKDLIGEGSSLIGNILIDTQGNHLQQHNRRVNIGSRTLLYSNYVDTEQGWTERDENANIIKKLVMDEEKKRGMFPTTVGMSMLNQLSSSAFNYKTSKDQPQLSLAFSSIDYELFRDTTIDTFLFYRLYHNETSTQNAYVQEDIHNPPNFPSSDIVLNSVTNGSFTDEEIAGTIYDIAPNEVKIFSDLLKRRSNAVIPAVTSKIISLFDNLNNKALSVIRDSIISTPNGGTPMGFSYGFEDGQEIGFDDLTYVNPDADPNNSGSWEYTFREKDAVLGKSATENPRVHFLDPAVHGGRYRFPKIYIEPATYNGWLGTIKTFVPQIQTCEDKDNGFLNMTEIAKRAKKVESNLPVDPRLSEALECRLEVPYDRQLMPANHGLLEGVIISAIRTYASEFMIRSFPVFGSIQFNEHNFDSLVSQALVDHMQTEMSDAGVFANVSRLAYYLLFLEQSVQVVQRQIIDGLMKETEEMRKASKIINRAQNDYEKLKIIDLISGNMGSEIKRQLSKGTRILAYGNHWASRSYDDFSKLRTLNGYKINLARKIAVLHDTQDAAKVFLSALVAKETSILSKKLNLNMRPRPHVYNIQRYMLSTDGIVDQSDIKAGFASVEQEVIEGGSQPAYGNIIDCAGSDLISPLGPVSKTIEEIKKTGYMYLEKYIRVINKDATEQVMKISEFQKMISDRSIYDEELVLSDYFGNASIVEDKIEGSIGVKFGVRLMMCLDKHIGLQPNLEKSIERIPSSITSEEQTFEVLCFPIASYELDLIDNKIKDLDLQDPNLGEDIKCYVDQLSETEDYKILFDKVIKTRSFCSLFGIYSFQNFINSIGQVEVEDASRKIMINDGWKEKIFNDTKKVLRKQFGSVYNSQDDEDGRGRSGRRTSNIDFLKNLIPDIYLNIKGVGFLKRLRIVDANPFDEDGQPCVNEFQALFED